MKPKQPTLTIQPPRRLNHYEVLQINPLELSDIGVLRQVNLQNQRFDGLRADSLSLLETQLQQLSFRHGQLPRLELVDSFLDNLDFSNSLLERLSLTRSQVQHCKWVGIDGRFAAFKDVSFKHCNFELARLGKARFQNVSFEHCQLKDVDFQGAIFKNVRFRDCDLTHLDLSDTQHQQLDLRGSLIPGLRARPQELKGLMMDPEQALSLVHLLGIQVMEAD